MKTRLLLPSLLAFLCLAGEARPDPDAKPARAILFSGNHYTGERIELKPGEQIDDFRFQRFPSGRNANNRISSILIEGDVEVTIFEYRNYEGDHLTLDRSAAVLERASLVSDAENWGNNLSSVIVRERPSRRDPPDRRGDRNDDDRDRDDRDRGRNDRDDDERDRDWGRDRDRHDRRDDRHRDWEREREERARERERARIQRETEAVVRRAYRDVLGRDPDEHGLQTYVGILQDRGWDESRLRNELMRSAEYRTVVVPREITTLYREVLGREPDPAGLRFYTDRVVRANWTFSRVKDALERSPEYRARPRR